VIWLSGVRYAVVCGPAIDADVLKYLSRMRDLRHLFFSRTTSLRSEDLAILQLQQPIEELGLLFFDPGSGLVEQIQKMRIVGSVLLVGIPNGKVLSEELSEKLPLSGVTYHPGAVLGVRCDTFGPCIVKSLVPASGAAVGGVQVNDMIVAIGNNPVRQFEDLRRIVANLTASKVLPVEIIRSGQSIKLEITLGEMHP
jgi:membrane-associated protease RseP (regulator of RpoE activity)